MTGTPMTQDHLSVEARAILADLRGRKLLKYLFAGDPEQRAAYGYVDQPIELATQHEIAEALAKAVLDADQRSPLPEGERQAIVAWLREQADLGAEKGIASDKGSTRRAAFGGGSLALSRAAAEIEKGTHVVDSIARQLAAGETESQSDLPEGVEGLVERLGSHMGAQDVAILLADCRKAAQVIASQALLLREAGEALEPFANVARRIRETQPKSDAWLEKVLFYMGTDDDPTKWSLTGKAFDRARTAASSIEQVAKL